MSHRGLRGFLGQGAVVAFAVDGGDFAPHGTEIGRKLTAMMNGVVEAEQEKKDGGLLEEAAEVNDFGELFAGKFGEGVEIFAVGLFVPSSDFARSGDAVRNFDGTRTEDTIDGSFDEEIFGDGDVPDQFDSGFGARIRLVSSFVRGNSFQNSFGGAGFGPHCGKKNIMKEEVRLFRREAGHRDLLFGRNHRDEFYSETGNQRELGAGTASGKRTRRRVSPFAFGAKKVRPVNNSERRAASRRYDLPD